jgi:hypothetical protein
MDKRNYNDKIVNEVSNWKGVSAFPHRFGGTEFRYGKPEIGHIHRNGLADIPFPTKIRDELIKENMAHPHHVLPETGWISFYVRNAEDIKTAILLFRLSYLRYAIKRDENNSSYKDELENTNLPDSIKSIYGKMFIK